MLFGLCVVVLSLSAPLSHRCLFVLVLQRSYLVMSIVENGNQYELMLRGTTSSPSVAAPEVTLPHVDVATYVLLT